MGRKHHICSRVVRLVGDIRSLVPGVLNSRYILVCIYTFFSGDKLYLSTHVPGTHQELWLHVHRMICKS